MSTLVVRLHLNGYLAPFICLWQPGYYITLCSLGTMQPVISFWVLCNPFNLFGYYATRLIRFWVLCNPLCCFWVLCNPLYRFLGTMQPVSSYFFLWVLCNPIFGYHETCYFIIRPFIILYYYACYFIATHLFPWYWVLHNPSFHYRVPWLCNIVGYYATCIIIINLLFH